MSTSVILCTCLLQLKCVLDRIFHRSVTFRCIYPVWLMTLIYVIKEIRYGIVRDPCTDTMTGQFAALN